MYLHAFSLLQATAYRKYPNFARPSKHAFVFFFFFLRENKLDSLNSFDMHLGLQVASREDDSVPRTHHACRCYLCCKQLAGLTWFCLLLLSTSTLDLRYV